MAKVAVLASGLSRAVFPQGESRETKLNQPSKEAKASFPYYNLLDHDPIANMKWRIYVRGRCLEDLEFREDILQMCREDIAFFGETFGIIFEPRPSPRPMPLVWWTDQVDVLAWAEECYGERDMGLEKTRGIGISWEFMFLAYAHWRLGDDGTKIGLMSKDEVSLDSDDDNSLMGKIEYIHNHMPAWLRFAPSGLNIMRKTKKDHTIRHLLKPSTVQGFVPTDDKMRGLRFTISIYDEFAFLTRDVQANMNTSIHTCPCRFFISTWNGSDNEFHTIMRRNKSTLLRVRMYWWNNPERYKGAYTTENSRVKILDKGYEYPKDFPFVLDGLLRSPWVDFELARAGSDVQSALEELYGLQAEAGRKLVKPGTIDIIETTEQLPIHTGEICIGKHKFLSQRDGRLKIWEEIGEGKMGPFSVASDISYGRGTTDSTIEVISLTTGNQVAEWAGSDLNPVEFARYVYSFLTWLNGHLGDGHSYFTFENNGEQGIAFCNELLRLGYGNIMKRPLKSIVKRGENRSTYYGYRNQDGGLSNILELERAIRDADCTIRSPWLKEELSLFDKDDENKGRPKYPRAAPGNGDKTQGMGMAWMQARERMVDVPIEQSTDPQAEIKEDYENWESHESWEDAWGATSSGYGV